MDYNDRETEIIIQSQKKYGYRLFHIRRGNPMTEPTGTVTIGKQVALRQDEATSEGSETRQSFVGRVWEKFIRKFKGNKADIPRRRNFIYKEILSLPVGAKELPHVQRVNLPVEAKGLIQHVNLPVPVEATERIQHVNLPVEATNLIQHVNLSVEAKELAQHVILPVQAKERIQHVNPPVEAGWYTYIRS